MSHSDQDIPTLTDFIRTGDADMHHHFDTQQFSIGQDNDWASTDTVEPDEDTFSADGFRDIDLAADEYGSEAGTSDPHNTAQDLADFDPLHIAAVEIDQVPAELAPFDPALVEDDTPTDDTDEYLELDVEEVISPEMPTTQMSTDGIQQPPAATSAAMRQQIDQAVDELLPSMAEQLKHNLYRHFQCQSDVD